MAATASTEVSDNSSDTAATLTSQSKLSSLSSPEILVLHSQACQAAALGDWTQLSTILDRELPPNTELPLKGVISRAAEYGQLETLQCLLRRPGALQQVGGAITEAAQRGHYKVVEYLLDLVPIQEVYLQAVVDLICPLLDSGSTLACIAAKYPGVKIGPNGIQGLILHSNLAGLETAIGEGVEFDVTTEMLDTAISGVLTLAKDGGFYDARILRLLADKVRESLEGDEADLEDWQQDMYELVDLYEGGDGITPELLNRLKGVFFLP
jgi:hypothetical protein